MATVTFKCPNCGGGLAFDPATQKFRCEYCVSLFAEEELEKLAAAKAARDAQEEPQPPPATDVEDDFAQHSVVYSCPSCGAEVVCDETTAATFCYYCHNPVTLAGRLSGGLKPDKLIPFTVTREQAESRFLEWVRKKWFVPGGFFAKQQIEKITGVYFPYWFTDCDVHGTLEAKATQVRIWRMGDVEYTETKIFNVQRAGNIGLTDISRTALKKANGKLVEGVQPFDTSKMIDFSMSYLSGFQAEKRDIERADLEQNVEEEARRYTERLLHSTIGGYATVSPSASSFKVNDAQWHYALLPVWVLTYNSGGTVYYYAMNGQTGNVCGVLPLDWKRLAVLAAAIAVPLFAILTIGGMLL